MLRTILISETAESAGQLRYLSDSCGIFRILKDFSARQSSVEIQRTLVLEPEVVLLESMSESTCLAEMIAAQCPRALVIEIGGHSEAASAADAVLTAGAGAEALFEAIPRAIGRRLSNHRCQLFTFLPAKAGSGCSTIALNVAVKLAQEHGLRVLFVDADLRSSALTAMMGVNPPVGLESLFDQFDNMTTIALDRGIVQWHGVELLLASRSMDAGIPSPAHYIRLLSSALGRFDCIVVDLPELVNPATLSVVRASHERYVVCTTEIPSLALAEQRLLELARLRVLDEEVGVVVNRWQRTDPSPKRLAELLGQARIVTLPNDYRTVQKSFADCEPLAASKLADAIKDFARSLAPSGGERSGIGGTFKRLFRFPRAASDVA